MEYTVDGVVFKCDVEIPESEANNYIQRAVDLYGEYLGTIEAHVDGEEIELTYHLINAPRFQRIRRITGYLVGTLERFNDGKRAEEAERVKHSV